MSEPFSVFELVVYDSTVWRLYAGWWLGTRGKRLGERLTRSEAADLYTQGQLSTPLRGVLSANHLDAMDVGEWVVGVDVPGVVGVFAQKVVGPGGKVAWMVPGQRNLSSDTIADMGVRKRVEVDETFRIVGVAQSGKNGRYAVMTRGLSGSTAGADVLFWVEPVGDVAKVFEAFSSTEVLG